MASGSSRYVVVGAGIHGLSTAWHLAKELRDRGLGGGGDVLVLDKADVGAGASGIACGIVRNNYFQSAMRRLMAHSVDVWETNQKALSYHPVGYLQISPDVMHDGVARIHAEQRDIGYSSSFVEGESRCRDYMRELVGDWQARGVTSILHEHRGGFANNMASVRGLAGLARGEGVTIRTGVEVIGFTLDSGAVREVHTDAGTIRCEAVVLAVGPWIAGIWTMLDLPETVPLRRTDGTVEKVPVWTYWLLQEGTVRVDPASVTDTRGNPPPVIHVDTDAPLRDDDGELVTDELWGIYYKPDAGFGGVQGGCMPRRIDEPAAEVEVDPYGPCGSKYVVDEEFVRMWTAGLAHCQRRFRGARALYAREPSGGIGCFTPDSFPVFDTFRQNAYVIADSNHGYKMVGVGALVAKELLGARQELLEPFRFARYERGDAHPVSNSPFPWS